MQVVHRYYPSRVNLTDRRLAHQIVLRFESGTGHIAVSCNCLRQRGGGHAPLAVRPMWQPGEALQRWRDHMAEVGNADRGA